MIEQVKEWMRRFVAWLRDPFHRDEIARRHTEIICEIEETKTRTKRAVEYRSEFPISRLVGNKTARREHRRD